MKFGFLIVGVSSLFSISSKASLETVSFSLPKADLACTYALENPFDDLKGMFLRLSLIIDKVKVTPTNKNILNSIRRILSEWKIHQNNRRVEIEDLLIIFYFFDRPPSIALSSSSLYLDIDFNKLKSKPYPSETIIQQLLIIINRHLRNYIIELQSKFVTDLNNLDFSIMDLSREIHIPYQILDNILNTDFVPNYSQIIQILNRDQKISREITKIIRSLGLDVTKKRFIMLNTILKRGYHFSVKIILEDIKQELEDLDIDVDTVYRFLRSLVNGGHIKKIYTGEKLARYEWVNQQHHDNFYTMRQHNTIINFFKK